MEGEDISMYFFFTYKHLSNAPCLRRFSSNHMKYMNTRCCKLSSCYSTVTRSALLD